MVTHHGVSLGASFASESRFGFASAPRLGGSVSSFIDFPGAPIDVSSQLNVELVRSSLVHLSVEREGLGRLDAVGGALDEALLYTLSRGQPWCRSQGRRRMEWLSRLVQDDGK